MSEMRVFTSYPLITFFADSEEEAARMLFALNDVINATPGVQTELDEECYEVPESCGETDRGWNPGDFITRAAAGMGETPA